MRRQLAERDGWTRHPGRVDWPFSLELHGATRAELAHGIGAPDADWLIMPAPDGAPWPDAASEYTGAPQTYAGARVGAWYSWLLAASRADRQRRLDLEDVAAGRVPDSWTCPAADAEHWPASLSAGIVECGNCGCMSDAMTGEPLP